jgi:hypothetical protein
MDIFAQHTPFIVDQGLCRTMSVVVEGQCPRYLRRFYVYDLRINHRSVFLASNLAETIRST